MRASAACELAGIPTASLVSEGYISQAKAVAKGLGLAHLALSLVPGHPTAQSADTLKNNIVNITLRDVIHNLTQSQKNTALEKEEKTDQIVFKGGFDEVNHYFYTNELSDGLPVVPPTLERISAFLKITPHRSDHIFGILPPDGRPASVWSIAVNGVMAGCRPEYMPILVALVQAMLDPHYGVEHSGNNPGGETLIMINGPIAKQLQFNHLHGVLRDGFLANTTVGRFWRLYLRNVAGFLPSKSDRATFGNTWKVVLSENESVLEEIGWEPNNVEMGFTRDCNTVTIARYTGGDVSSSVFGQTPAEIMPFLAASVLRQVSWQIMFTVGQSQGSLRPLILLTPAMARIFAKAGCSKQDVKQLIFEHARLPACHIERLLRDWTRKGIWNIADEVKKGTLPKHFHESDDPERLVPIVWKAADYMIAVTGDELRNDVYVFAHNGILGYPVGKKIELPADWSDVIKSIENIS